MATAIGPKLHITPAGFVIGTTDAIRRHGQKPGKEPKIQTSAAAQQRNVGLRTKDEKRTTVADAQSQPCRHKTACYVQTLLCHKEAANACLHETEAFTRLTRLLSLVNLNSYETMAIAIGQKLHITEKHC